MLVDEVFRCAKSGCPKTARDEPLYRVNRKGPPGQFMCSEHYEERMRG